jgi:hypothetical protein
LRQHWNKMLRRAAAVFAIEVFFCKFQLQKRKFSYRELMIDLLCDRSSLGYSVVK